MLALLATSTAFAPTPQRLLTATLAGGWQLKLTELDPVTGDATDTLISALRTMTPRGSALPS